MFAGPLLRSIRDYQRYANRKGLLAIVGRKFARGRHVFWSLATHSDIDPKFKHGSDLSLPHPNGIVIHGDAIVGSGCMIMQQVTIGIVGSSGAPIIGNNVYIGAGAKIIGAIKIGEGARIGANAVVLCDVPAGYTAVGVPVRLINRELP